MTEELGRMRTADMNLNQLLVAVNRISMAQKLTLRLHEFCEITGKDKSKVYALLRSRYYPEELIIGGYESRKTGKTLLFDTEKVLEWMRR
ncbi:hypothetical protein U9K52_09700 [Chryseobacterium sp. MHB01]|uniref:hypothetical protein n=1 Tax=Chryseobacterium sp. MHB01 TaxID=3109433 RepID=UPI002AFF82A7|nr:hypothetical protein [Chryseobacterium sp. MHB01]MEA1849185.1 hypothetical protein [Chryseobacterium sp. MHB01]